MRAAVLCPSLPFASRMNILQSFDQSLFELLIATDDFLEKDSQEQDEEEEKEEHVADKQQKKSKFKVRMMHFNRI